MDRIADRVRVTGCTREMHGVLGRLLRRDRSSTGLAPSFVFRCWLPRASTGRLRAARSADRRRLCVRSLSLSPSLYSSPSVPPTTETRRCCANLTRFRWLSVSSSIAETDDDGDRPACPRRNGSPRLLQV